MERRVENFFGESVDLRQAATSPGNTASTKSDVLCPATARARRWEDIAGQTWYSGDGCRPQACRPQANPCDSSKLRVGLCRKARLAKTREDDPGQNHALVHPSEPL